MDNKKIIIIGIFLIIIAGAALVILTTTVNYERIEITPNGTSIEIPTNHQKYLGDYEGVKVWKWNYGALASYNSEKITNNLGLSGLSLNALNNIIKNGNSENIDGFTCYTLNANELLDYLEIKYNGNFYCIPLANETTHDNVIICCSDRDIALHIAKSVEYKTS